MCSLTRASASGNQIVIWVSLNYLGTVVKAQASLFAKAFASRIKDTKIAILTIRDFEAFRILKWLWPWRSIPQFHRLGLIDALVTKPNLVCLIKWRFICRWCEQRMHWRVCILYIPGSIITWHCIITWTTKTNGWNAGSNVNLLLYMRAANGSDESAHLHRLAWVLVSRHYDIALKLHSL